MMATANVGELATIGVLVAFSVWFFIVGLQSRRRGRGSPKSYFGKSNTLFVGSGTVTLLAYWVTGNTLMAAPELTYSRGVIGSVDYALIGAIGLIVFAPIARRIKDVVPGGGTVGDFVVHRYGRITYTLLLCTQILYSLGVLVTQSEAGKYALEDVIGVPNQGALALVLFVVMTYTAIGGFEAIVRVGFVQVFIILTVAVTVPIYIYLKYGTNSVYAGIVSHHASSLSLAMPGASTLLLAGALMGIGEVAMDNGFWQRVFAIRERSVARSFILSGLVWMSVPVALSTLAFIALAQGINSSNPSGIAPYIAETVGGWLMGSILLIGVWAAVTSTIGGFLNSLVSILVHDVFKSKRDAESRAEERRIGRIGRVTTVGIGVFLYLICLNNNLSLYNTLTVLGVMNAALVSPIVFGLYGTTLRDRGAAGAVVLALVLGYSTFFGWSHYWGIVVSFFVSMLFCSAASLFAKMANQNGTATLYVSRGEKEL